MSLPDTLVDNSMKVLLLSGLRVDPVVGARWGEIDFKKGIWMIPSDRIKGWSTPFRVPITSELQAVFERSRRFASKTDFVFESRDSASLHLSNNSHRLWIQDKGWKDADGRLATAHGLRFTFRDWADDVGGVDDTVAEHYIQHKKAKAGQTVAAYFRSDQLEKRRKVMADWELFLTSKITSAANKQALAEKAQARLATEVEDTGRTLRDVKEWARSTAVEYAEAVAIEKDIAEHNRRTHYEDGGE